VPKPDLSPPRLPSTPEVASHDQLDSYDEWNGELVTGADLAGANAEHVRIGRSELRGVELTGAELHRCAFTDARSSPRQSG
jgi:uncharacterized protein YjbI with pentapeptide repeats